LEITVFLNSQKFCKKSSEKSLERRALFLNTA
jgi:hypothetical protein